MTREPTPTLDRLLEQARARARRQEAADRIAGGPRHRRALAVAAAILVTAGAIVAITRPAGQRPAPPAAFAPQPDRRFIRVGTVTNSQFTDAQFDYLAANFGYVLFAKFHDGWSIEGEHEAARRLHRLNPDLEIFPYFSTKYWFDQNRYPGEPFNPSWYLRDSSGKVIYDYRRDEDEIVVHAPLVDLTNPDYRAWALRTLRSWLDAAPYAGVALDAAEPIGDYGDADIAFWDQQLGPARVQAYNQAMRDFIGQVQALVTEALGPTGELLINGVAPSPNRGPQRNVDLLAHASGALDEFFCLDSQGNVRGIEDDLALMAAHPDRQFFMRTSYKVDFDQRQRDRYSRLCEASFLLGWDPGRTYFQFATDYTSGQIDHDDVDNTVDVGTPVAAYTTDGSLLSREFTHGIVYVNVGPGSARVTLPRAVTEVGDGHTLATFAPGDQLTIEPQTAALLVDSAFLETSR